MQTEDRFSYTGDVQVGGPAQTRSLAALTITKLAVGAYDNNAYLLRSTGGHALLIDAAAEPDRLLELIGDQRLDAILTTHAHADHWQALEAVREATGAKTFAGRLDAPDIPVSTDVRLDGGDVIEVGDLRLRTVHLSGHTPGSIVAILDDPAGHPHVFTGDCLFPGGIGKTWGDPERFASLYTGVASELFDTLPDESWVYPGHGADTTIGAERPHLEEWRQRGW